MRRRYRRLVILGLLLTGSASARAGELLAVVTAAGQPVADAVAYAIPRPGAASARAAATTERSVMDQRNRQFLPQVLAVQTGTPVHFPNSDSIRHHVYSFSPAKTFELPLYKGTPAEPVVFDRPGAVTLGCNIHDWMIGYVYVVDTPYFAVTAADGRARLTLPDGEYELRVWHPRLKDAPETVRRPVRVAGAEVRVDVGIALAPERRRPPPARSGNDAGDYDY
jgi:plastocyanin